MKPTAAEGEREMKDKRREKPHGEGGRETAFLGLDLGQT